MSKADDVFIRQFIIMLVLLAAYGVAAAFLGIWIAGSARDAAAGSERATLERIAPVGRVKLGEPGQPSRAVSAQGGSGAGTATATAAAADGSATDAGTGAGAVTASSSDSPSGGGGGPAAAADDKLAVATYKTYCFACHQTGVAQAPQTGDTEQWAARAGKGFDALYQSVLNGQGAMLPRAGFPNLTDEELKAGIRYLLAAANVTAD